MKISNVILFFAARIMLLALLFPLQACAAPLWYTAEPVQGNVVDAETGQPLEGVIITANWQLEGGIEGSYPVGQMMVMETVTDKDGRYRFPGWGPKHRPLNGRISTRAPQLLVFKSGYRYVGLANALLEKSLRGELDNPLRSDWDGKTIKMERFEGSLAEYARHLAFLKTGLGFAYNGEACEWKLVPRMLVSQHREEQRFQSQAVPNTLLTINDVAGQKKCGLASDFFKDYMR